MIRGWMVPLMAAGAYSGMGVAEQKGDSAVTGAVIGGLSALAVGIGVSQLGRLISNARVGATAAEQATKGVRDLTGAEKFARINGQANVDMIRARIDAMRNIDSFR